VLSILHFESIAQRIASTLSDTEVLPVEPLDLQTAFDLDIVVIDVATAGALLETVMSLRAHGCEACIVSLLPENDVYLAAGCMRAGSSDVLLGEDLEGPHGSLVLQEALKNAADTRPHRRRVLALRQRMKRLTQREHEVLMLLVEGLSIKDIAHQLGRSEKTVSIHRGHVMTKLRVNGLAEMVRAYLILHPQAA
jgi:FixJ family two-component response regulator